MMPISFPFRIICLIGVLACGSLGLAQAATLPPFRVNPALLGLASKPSAPPQEQAKLDERAPPAPRPGADVDTGGSKVATADMPAATRDVKPEPRPEAVQKTERAQESKPKLAETVASAPPNPAPSTPLPSPPQRAERNAETMGASAPRAQTAKPALPQQVEKSAPAPQAEAPKPALPEKSPEPPQARLKTPENPEGPLKANPEAAPQSVRLASASPSLAPAARPEPVESLRAPSPRTPGAEKPQPDPETIFLTANSIDGVTDWETTASGEVEAWRDDMTVNADRIIYHPLEDEMEASGQVRLVRGGNVVTGPKMRMWLDARSGFVDSPSYLLKYDPQAKKEEKAEETVTITVPRPSTPENPFAALAPPQTLTVPRSIFRLPEPPTPVVEAQGEAERIDFEGGSRVRIQKGTYSTCKPGDRSWFAYADDIFLDYDRQVGEARGSTVYFQDLPILYTPWMSFPLDNERHSGFLAPVFGSTSDSGFQASTPYYWNIAPNFDATFAPHIYSKRGLMLGGEMRYLEPAYTGEVRAEMLHHDSVRNENRYAYSVNHFQNFGSGFSGSLELSGVSDDNYFSDLSSKATVTSQTQLLRRGVLNYNGGWWGANIIGQGFQTLQPDPQTRVDVPYNFAPQVNFFARRQDLLNSDITMMAQYTSFTHPTMVEAQRIVAYPSITLPFVTPGFYVKPKIGVHYSQYKLSQQAAGAPDSISRTLPIASLDAGMTFERNASLFGREMTQTLEPRLYYLYIPYRNQDRIPIFDTGMADFNFAQAFSENVFSGQDRINDANQVTAALSSRLIDSATGREYLRVMVGQQYYFHDPRVTLTPGSDPRSRRRSDFLAAATGQVVKNIWFDTALQYNPNASQDNGRVDRFSFGARYYPEAGKVLNAAYRFDRENFKQIDLSGQWTFAGRWSLVGRYNYSFMENQLIEALGGLEYNGGCWAIRVVANQLVTVSRTRPTSFFVQLELGDFSRIGSGSSDLLSRNISGYSKINAQTRNARDFLFLPSSPSQSLANPTF
ncbi:MAG: LPS assembly protein LptD [Betaproteobacteria bacterium]|nr:LPS assembly protein LptD [Betaproteobacteria bacterium]